MDYVKSQQAGNLPGASGRTAQVAFRGSLQGPIRPDPSRPNTLFCAFEENPLHFGRQIKIGRKASRRPGSHEAIS